MNISNLVVCIGIRIILLLEICGIVPIHFSHFFQLFECQSRLRIGFYYDDNYLKPVPAVKRAVNMAKNFLSEAGHELIPFYVPRIEEAIKMFTQSKGRAK